MKVIILPVFFSSFRKVKKSLNRVMEHGGCCWSRLINSRPCEPLCLFFLIEEEEDGGRLYFLYFSFRDYTTLRKQQQRGTLVVSLSPLLLLASTLLPAAAVAAAAASLSSSYAASQEPFRRIGFCFLIHYICCYFNLYPAAFPKLFSFLATYNNLFLICGLRKERK